MPIMVFLHQRDFVTKSNAVDNFRFWGTSPEWCDRPYALRYASYVRRSMPRKNHSKSPEEVIAKSKVCPTTKYLQPFGCPVYVLQDALQGGYSIPKWDGRSRVGDYLGHSSQHAQNILLIMNAKTGYVSPQFHCLFDNPFDSKNNANFNKLWAEKAGLRAMSNKPEQDDLYTDYHMTKIPPTMQTPFDAEVPADRN